MSSIPKKFSESGGTFEMIQLWVNLPKKYKNTKPRYQPITKEKIPLSSLYSIDNKAAPLSDGFVRVMAGNFQGVKGPAKTFSQVELYDVEINNIEKEYSFDFLKDNNVIIFSRRGKFKVQNQTVNSSDAIILSIEGKEVNIQALEPNCQILVMAGKPLNEPIAAQGPFVMNTESELRKAFDDYRHGRF